MFPPQSTFTSYPRTARKNYSGLDGSDDEDASDKEYTPNGSSGSNKRKNEYKSRGRRVKTSFSSTSSGSSTHSPAPTPSSYGSPTPSSSSSSSSSPVASSSKSSSSRPSAKSKSKPKSSGRKSTSQAPKRAPKRARAVEEDDAPTPKSRLAKKPRIIQLDSEIADLALPDFIKHYEAERLQVVWDAKGRAPCPVATCNYRFHEGRNPDDKRHYISHSKHKPIWVCSEEIDGVLVRHPEYRLPLHENGGCDSPFSRKDAVVRHLKLGSCAH